MKNNYIQKSVLAALCIFCFIATAEAQRNYTVAASKNNNMKLSGTSSMHDWEMNAVTFTSDAQFVFKKGDDQQITGLNSLSFSLPTTNLKSDKKGLDENAYDALKVKKNKNILYKLVSATIGPKKDNTFLINTVGNLTIAGITKEVSMDVHCVINKDATISCSGSDKLNMTDYKVTPPSFMFGAMKTGEKVTLDFMLVYKN